jgi:hypothetical protein
MPSSWPSSSGGRGERGNRFLCASPYLIAPLQRNLVFEDNALV